MLKYFPIHLIFIPVLPEISINCSSGNSHKLSKRLDSEAMAKMALKQLCSQICIYRGFEHIHTSLKRAVIVDIKEKYGLEWNSVPSLWLKICIFQQGRFIQIFQSTELI